MNPTNAHVAVLPFAAQTLGVSDGIGHVVMNNPMDISRSQQLNPIINR
jgi:hypothetical protein